jgi:acyl-coenzyme A synthetase/AMP-(fatty) acid ligase
LAIIDDKGRAITYAELKERTMDLAIHFFIRGWKKQAVIALFMPNVFEWALTFLSAAKAGMIVTPGKT